MFEEEHHGHALPESGAELSLRAHWLVLGVIAATCAGGNVEWSWDVLVAAGILGPVLMMAIHRTTEGPFGPLLGRFVVWMIPCWLVAAIFMASLLHPAIALVNQDTKQVWEMLPLPPAWMPVSAQVQPGAIELLFVLGIYATGLNALLIPQGRLVFARTWAMLVLCAGMLALVGLLQWFTHTDKILWFIPIENLRFFATFPHRAQWCAFALLWMSASLGLLAWLVRQRGWRWLSGDGWLLLTMTILLGGSVMAAGDPLHKLLAALVAGVGSFVVAWQTWTERVKGTGRGFATTVWLLTALVLLAGAALIASHHHPGGWIKYAGDRPGESLHARVLEDTQNMWHERPWFGWGQASFNPVYSFFQQSDQGFTYWAYARSDFWQSLAENGIVGTVLWWLPALWVCVRLLWARRLASFLIAPAAGLVSLLVLAVVDFPFASPAVFFGFWLVLFSVARWSEVDTESTKSTLSERRRVKRERARGHTVIHHPSPAKPPQPASAPPAA